ncbi:MAG: hypothetical protein KU28_06495 [Sulfurovum sp. PC08-66]|nr:MAG: hypothetical protein KU28_06495 [Sulfurovum sp. PC08-66]
MTTRYPSIESLEQLQAMLSSRFDEGFLSLKDLPHPHTLNISKIYLAISWVMVLMVSLVVMSFFMEGIIA